MTIRTLLLTALLFGGGCLSPFVRYPSILPGSLESQSQELPRHDPFADKTLGPDTFTRPRDIDLQRSEPRRSREVTVPAQPSASYPNVISP